MFCQPSELAISLPPWVAEFACRHEIIESREERMRFVVEASRKNISEGTGGPFAAAVFVRDSGQLVALGVNLVERESLSMLHAEMMAISVAQKKLGVFDLGRVGVPVCELVTSTEPCAMCLGAIPWSGIRQVVTGAGEEDARAIGFDEGSKAASWQQALESRGITVITGVLRSEAASVLQEYRRQGGLLYNGRASNGRSNNDRC